MLVIEGKPLKEIEEEEREEIPFSDPVLYIKDLMEKGTDKKDAIKIAAKAYNISKREVYDLAKEISGV